VINTNLPPILHQSLASTAPTYLSADIRLIGCSTDSFGDWKFSGTLCHLRYDRWPATDSLRDIWKHIKEPRNHGPLWRSIFCAIQI